MYFACTKAPWKNDTFIANAVAGMPRTFVLSVFVFTLREWGPRSSKCAQHASPLAGRQEQRTTLAAHIYLSPRTTRPHTPSSTRITLSSPTQARRALGLLLMPWCNSGMESHSVALMAVPRARGKTDIKNQVSSTKGLPTELFSITITTHHWRLFPLLVPIHILAFFTFNKSFQYGSHWNGVKFILIQTLIEDISMQVCVAFKNKKKSTNG